MISLEIPKEKISINIPENLGECNKKQFLYMSRFIMLYVTGQISYDSFKTLAIHKLLNLEEDKGKPEEAWNNIAYISEKVFDTTKQDGYFREVEKNGKKSLEINQNFMVNPMQLVKVGLVHYVGPDANFTNITAGQYVDALNTLQDYEATKEAKYLYNLFNILYRRKKYGFFGKAIRYKEEEDVKREDIITHLDPGYIFGCLLMFTSFQIALNQTSIFYNGNEIAMRILFESSNTEVESNIPGLGMKSILYDVAETGIYGTIEKVRATNNWEIMLKLYDAQKKRLDEIERNKQATKQNSNGSNT